MIAVILAFLDVHKFFAFISEPLEGIHLVLNIIASVIMLISVISTIFSGWEYVKNGKDLLKD